MPAGSGVAPPPPTGAAEASRRRGSGSPAGKLPAVPDLVAIDLPGGPTFVAALQRAWDGGDAVLPLDQRLSPTATEAVLAELRPTRIVRAGGETNRLDGLPVQAGDALVVATSGTTGRPKGVVLTHDAVKASAVATSARLGVDPERHRWLACLPLNHVGGLSVVTRSLVTGTPLTVLPRFEPAAVTSEAGPDVMVSLVPTALGRVGAKLFHTVVLGGSAPPPDLPSNVVTTYGLTETGSGVVYDGRPLDGVEVEVDASTSEIRLRGAMLLRAYRDGAPALDASGWFSTGDAGRIDGDGRLHVRGRLTDLIVSGGENIWPAPVEAALRCDPRVAEVVVAGRPDPEWGERVIAWVVPVDAARPPGLALRAIVAERVAPYAAPRQLVLVDDLPRTGIGKVRRDSLPDPDG
jgi:o-succinylbenzoate---CoA ligase